MNNKRSIALITLLVTGCSGSSNNNSDNSTGTYTLTISGGSCAASSTTAVPPDPDTSVTVPATQEVNCPDEFTGVIPGPGISNTGNGSVVNNGTGASITTAVFEALSTSTTSSIVEIQLHNGEFRSIERTVTNGTDTATQIDTAVYNATVFISMELSQDGTDGFSGGSFDVNVPDSLNYAPDVFFFIDQDGDRKPSTQQEVSDAVSGNINVSGSAPDWLITFDLTLQNGSTLTGSYTGALHNGPQ